MTLPSKTSKSFPQWPCLIDHIPTVCGRLQTKATSREQCSTLALTLQLNENPYRLVEKSKTAAPNWPHRGLPAASSRLVCPRRRDDSTARHGPGATPANYIMCWAHGNLHVECLRDLDTEWESNASSNCRLAVLVGRVCSGHSSYTL